MYYFLDKLTKNLVNDAIEWDKKDNLHKAPSQRSDYHLQGLVKCISSCGVSFNVWEKVDADGKGSGLYDFTSLMGSDKKLLLENLPEKLTGVIRPETSETVIKIWKVYCSICLLHIWTTVFVILYIQKYTFLYELYAILGCNNPIDEQIMDFLTAGYIKKIYPSYFIGFW